MEKDILKRYEQARALMQGGMTNRIVMNDAVYPHWIEGTNQFWYKRASREGGAFRLVDAESASAVDAFDHNALAGLLGDATGKDVDAGNLPLQNVAIDGSPLQVHFSAFGKRWCYLTGANRLSEESFGADAGLPSPDGASIAFTREHNLWVRDAASGRERQLTTDGSEKRPYARNQYFEMPSSIEARWSPDSKRLLTVQLDTRGVSERPIIEYVPADGSLRPQLHKAKRPYSGDPNLTTCRILTIDAVTGAVQPADHAAFPAMDFGPEQGYFSGKPFGWWSGDSQRAWFIDVARGGKAVHIIELHAATGATRVVIEETSDTFVNLCHTAMDLPQFLPLPETEELIWFSDRSGWAHLYLYDLRTGELKNQITDGEWLVREVLHFNAGTRDLLIQTAARDESISPYYRDVCRVQVDTGKVTPVVNGDFDHVVYRPCNFTVSSRVAFGLESPGYDGLAPSGQFFVATRSRVDTVPVSALYDRSGRELLVLETADVSGLPKNWTWPEPVKLMAADEKTPLYGAVFRPPGFSADQRYPVIDFSPSMRDYACVPQASFHNEALFGLGYLGCAALAALGFIVVAVEGRGTPNRHKNFQTHGYGDYVATSDLRDRMAALRQLAQRYPYLDLDRVGVTGVDNYSNSVYALLQYPDFYKVAVVYCPMEPEFIDATVAEMYYGMPLDGKQKGKGPRAEDLVGSLQGKLLMIDGMLSLATPASTFRLVEALQKANKDFDLLLDPTLGHDITSYGFRRCWDYLVRHLLGTEPPHEFHLTTGVDLAVAAAKARATG